MDEAPIEASPEVAQTAEPVGPRMRYRCAGSKRKPKQCDYEAHDPWPGRCPRCGKLYDPLPIKGADEEGKKPLTMGAARDFTPPEYISTGIRELDDVLGGGIVLGNVILLGGGKGNGKSTVCMQIEAGFASAKHPVLHAVAEMSGDQVLGYAHRVGAASDHVAIYANSHIDVDEMLERAEQVKAKLIVVDSLQKCEFEDIDKEPGNPAQVDASIKMITSTAKKYKIAFIVISHMNSFGEFKGSEGILHEVDVLLRCDVYEAPDNVIVKKRDEKALAKVRQFSIAEGKNRQGETDIVAMLEMTKNGLQPLSLATRRILLDIDLEAQREEDEEGDDEPEPEDRGGRRGRGPRLVR